MELVKTSLENLNVANDHIHLEYFSAVKSDKTEVDEG